MNNAKRLRDDPEDETSPLDFHRVRELAIKAEAHARATLDWAQSAVSRTCSDEPLDEGAATVLADLGRAVALEGVKVATSGVELANLAGELRRQFRE